MPNLRMTTVLLITCFLCGMCGMTVGLPIVKGPQHGVTPAAPPGEPAVAAPDVAALRSESPAAFLEDHPLGPYPKFDMSYTKQLVEGDITITSESLAAASKTADKNLFESMDVGQFWWMANGASSPFRKGMPLTGVSHPVEHFKKEIGERFGVQAKEHVRDLSLAVNYDLWSQVLKQAYYPCEKDFARTLKIIVLAGTAIHVNIFYIMDGNPSSPGFHYKAHLRSADLTKFGSMATWHYAIRRTQMQPFKPKDLPAGGFDHMPGPTCDGLLPSNSDGSPRYYERIYDPTITNPAEARMQPAFNVVRACCRLIGEMLARSTADPMKGYYSTTLGDDERAVNTPDECLDANDTPMLPASGKFFDKECASTSTKPNMLTSTDFAKMEDNVEAIHRFGH